MENAGGCDLVVGAGLKERWTDYLPLVVRILNATRNAGIVTGYFGCAPAEIVFGGRVHLNRELLPLADTSLVSASLHSVHECQCLRLSACLVTAESVQMEATVNSTSSFKLQS